MPQSPAPPTSPARWHVVASRFHQSVVDRLLAGAVDCLKGHGLEERAIGVVRVAGAFEVPQAVAALARQAQDRRPEGLVALAVVVRGETPHFDYICQQASAGLMSVALETGIPVGFGLLTCETLEQAMARAGGDAGNKGWDAAEAAWSLRQELARLAPDGG